MKIFTLFVGFLSTILTSVSFGQITGWVENFNDGNISKWEVETAHQTIFQLQAEDGTLRINYSRPGPGHEWDNMHYTPSALIDMSKQPLISLRIKSTINTTLSVKPVFENGSDNYMSTTISGDQNWHIINIKLTAAGTLKMNKMYMYINGGSSAVEKGTVWIDEFAFGDSATTIIDWTAFDRAFAASNALLLNSIEGSANGQFPIGSKSKLQLAVDNAKNLRNGGTKDTKAVSQAVWDLYDACSVFESAVIAEKVNLVDSIATKETRYLYLNFLNLTKRAFLFGMQDVTGYGVGWSNDDNRSDVKSVCGDYPALYCEDINAIERNGDLERMRYRITSAYNRGGVTAFVWHQNDPDGRGFYNTDVNNERIVSRIIPGGSRHNDYKTKLKNIALFVKSLRGKNGESIPIIFRPYHEHVGNWFWWGPAYATTDEYNTLWQFTVKYLRDSCNVHNMLWALSPSLDLVMNEGQYFQVYPGDKYVDIFGSDFYFGNTVTDSDREKFLSGLRRLVQNSVSRNKIAALTEVGQEALPTPDWFTNALLPPLKYDTIANSVVYAAVWRNASTTHHYAPYPGHPSVPDFMKFYNDPYTLFEKDLPKMYSFPETDKTAPLFVNLTDTMIISSKTSVNVALETNERAYLRYSFSDEPYNSMPYQFNSGEGTFNHTAVINGHQGDMKTLYVRASDLFGNATEKSINIKYVVDTLQAQIAWTHPLYPFSRWASGPSPIGSDTSAVTKTAPVRTVYFKRTFSLDQLPKALGVFVTAYGGAAVTINDNEVGRINLPSGTTLKFDTDPSGSSAFSKMFTLDSTALKSLLVGKNTIAVEVHAPALSAVSTFNSYVTDGKTMYIPKGSDWSYFDNGYRPADIKLTDITAVIAGKDNLPENYFLYGNYPNPFNPSTVISYNIPQTSHVSLYVFDVLGRQVATIIDQAQSAGRYEMHFDGSGLSSGIYILQMKAGEYYKTHKMMLIK